MNLVERNLSLRTVAALRREGIHTDRDLVRYIQTNPARSLDHIPDLGHLGLRDIAKHLATLLPLWQNIG